MIKNTIDIKDFADYKLDIVIALSYEAKRIIAEIDVNKSVILFRVAKKDFVSQGFKELKDAIDLYNML
ncbi:MAG: hypothetical protein WCO84_00980 [bacterium]